MSQASYVIPNDDGAGVRATINAAFDAIKSQNSHASTAPTSPVAGMRWCKTVDATHQEVYEYDGTNWVLLYTINPTTHVVDKPTFFADKNASNQASMTSATDVPVTFGTERWDVGGYFASSIWTPPAGKYRITVSIEWTATNGATGEILYTKLYKNGSVHRQVANKRGSTGGEGFNNSFPVEANGTDTFQIYGNKGGTGDGEISGNVLVTWFSGEAV